ncbi:MAG: protein kinase [Deltaproteobacteria bacterium]|nr:protein kinase [Deltaproteobacteria bacterium]
MATTRNGQLAAGTIIDHRYEIEQFAGTGAMGTVYRARDRASGARVAIKVCHRRLGQTADPARFRREAALLASVQHANIVAYLAHGATDADDLFIAMEWLSGETLARRLARSALALTEVVELGVQLARALCATHALGIVHRDLKPANLFLVDHRLDRVKLIDFGIARDLSAPERVTSTGVILGTPGYLAPEQARGDRAIDTAADIFSLGCVLYESLTGEPPFGWHDVADVLSSTLLAEPRRLAARRPLAPAALVALVERMLAKDAVLRPRDAHAVLSELRALPPMPKDEPVVAALPAATEQEQRLLCVIACEPPPTDGDRFSTLPATNEDPRRTWRAALRTDLGRLGADLEWLPGGALIATVSHAGAATDQVAMAARAALLLHQRWPDASIALGTGRGAAPDGWAARGEVVERTRLVARTAAGSPATLGIWIDDLSAGLLRDARFVIERAQLVREEIPDDEPRPLLGRPSLFVGRDQEMAILDALVAGCSQEQEARVGLVLAPPGVGKTRLRQEFLRRQAGRQTLLGLGDIMDASSPYAVLADALRRFGDLAPGRSPGELRAQLVERLGRHLPPESGSATCEFLGELCQVPFPDDERPHLRTARSDPAVMAERIEEAFIAFLRGECTHQPLLLVLEDLHWSDALSIKLVDAALRELADRPLLVLAFARPQLRDQFPRLWATHRVQEIALAGLGRRAAERLVVHSLGNEVPTAARARLIEQASGNTLFLEELIRAHAGGRGDAVPATVLAMLQVRLSRLDPLPRRMLCIASVFGQTFWRGGLLTLVGGLHFDDELRALVDGELIEPSPMRSGPRYPDEREYGFRHALMRDAAYALLSEDERCVAHRQAGQWLEQVGERDHAVLAEHYRLGAVADLATHHYVRAADQALANADGHAALALATRGLACGADGDVHAALRSLQAQATFLSDAALCRAAGFEALPALPIGGPRWCRTMAALLFVSVMNAERETFATLTTRLLEVAPSPDAVTLYLEALSYVLGCVGLLGIRALAVAAIVRIDQIVASTPAMDALAQAWVANSHFYFLRNFEADPWATLRVGEEGVARATESGALRLLTLLQSTLGMQHEEMGNPAIATQYVRAALARARKLRDPGLILHAGADLARLLAGRSDAHGHVEATALIAELLGYDGVSPVHRGLLDTARAQIEWHRGDVTSATASAEAASALLRPFPLLRFSAMAIQARGLVAAGLVADALAVCDEGAAHLHRLGGGCTEVTLRLAIAETRLAAGDRRDLGLVGARLGARAACIPDEAARTRFLAEVSDHRRILELTRQYVD